MATAHHHEPNNLCLSGECVGALLYQTNERTVGEAGEEGANLPVSAIAYSTEVGSNRHSESAW